MSHDLRGSSRTEILQIKSMTSESFGPDKPPHQRRKMNWRRQAIAWHQRIGLAIMAFALILALSGLVLNHSEKLGLSDTYVATDWLLDWYNIDQSTIEIGWETEFGWISHVDGHLFLNDHRLARKIESALVGVVWNGTVLAVATRDHVWLFQEDGTLIEKLLPPTGPIDQLGRTQSGNLRLRTENNTENNMYDGGQDAVTWLPDQSRETVIWSHPGNPPIAVIRSVIGQARHHVISWERFFLDLHSGRLFGTLGVLIADLTTLGLILLALSGLYARMTR